MGLAITVVEDVFKEKKFKYRVKTNNIASVPSTMAGGGAAIVGASIAMEAAAVAAPVVVGTVAIVGGALTGVGALALAGIAMHRMFTSNPDYEVIKYPLKKEIHLLFKK